MNLYLRLLRVLLTSVFREDLHYSEAVESAFRVWLHDLDALGHMNNGRYHQIMDVARAEWMQRTGVLPAIRRNRWAPILGGGFIRYRQSLKILTPYRVRTRLLGWDQRWFFLEHVFVDGRGRCVAVGVTRAALRAAGAWVHADEVVSHVHAGAESPPVPDHLKDWLELEEQMFRHGAHAEALAIEPLTETR